MILGPFLDRVLEVMSWVLAPATLAYLSWHLWRYLTAVT